MLKSLDKTVSGLFIFFDISLLLKFCKFFSNFEKFSKTSLTLSRDWVFAGYVEGWNLKLLIRLPIFAEELNGSGKISA